MLAVALPVVPSFGLRESALAAVGIGGGGAASGGGLIAGLGAHGAAKVAAVAIATGGAVGGVAVTHPELVRKAQAALERVASDGRGGVSGPTVGSREGSTARRGYFASDAAQEPVRKEGRRDEINTAGDHVAGQRKDRRSGDRTRRVDEPAQTNPPKDRAHGQRGAPTARNDRSRGGRGDPARSRPTGSSRGGGRKGGGRRPFSRPDAGEGRRRRGSFSPGKKSGSVMERFGLLNRGRSRSRERGT